LETNYLYDFSDQRLRKARCLLRLRFEGRQGVLTYKGAPLPSDQYKIRREAETLVSDGRRVREILEAVGLRENFSYQKFRTVYALRGGAKTPGPPYLEYDETPIGDYLELEGPGPWIDQVAFRLGYSRQDFIIRSYATLYFQKCAERGQKPSNMVFQPRRSK